MTQHKPLAERIDRGEVIILDAAIGTQLQEMGLPIYHTAWAATALNTHPATVQVMHEQYIKAGADIITTNTYASARHNLEPLGLGELTGELNRRAVLLAREARDKTARERPVVIAGSMQGDRCVLLVGFKCHREPASALPLHRRATPSQSARAGRNPARGGVDFLSVPLEMPKP
jgi:methionine synthase I (cobalamin-dependent)